MMLICPGILEERLGFATALDRMVGVAILAPSDDAIRSFLNNTTIDRMLASDPGAFEAFFFLPYPQRDLLYQGLYGDTHVH